MRLKVCGLTQVDQVYQLDAMGVSFGGFIFYPKSPRYVYQHLKAADIKSIKGNINKVGVFVNATEEEIIKTVDQCGLYLVQLHGDETPHFCERISNYISVIKAFRISEKEHLEWKLKDYIEVADMYLFDTAGNTANTSGDSVFGGTGKQFNWDILKGKNIAKPYFLSGGIGEDDCTNIKFFRQDKVAKDLFALDVNSRFELMPGIKDMKRIKQFITALNHT